MLSVSGLRHEDSLDRVESWNSVVDVLRRTKKRLFARAWLGCNSSVRDPCRGNMKLRVSQTMVVDGRDCEAKQIYSQ